MHPRLRWRQRQRQPPRGLPYDGDHDKQGPRQGGGDNDGGKGASGEDGGGGSEGSNGEDPPRLLGGLGDGRRLGSRRLGHLLLLQPLAPPTGQPPCEEATWAACERLYFFPPPCGRQAPAPPPRPLRHSHQQLHRRARAAASPWSALRAARPVLAARRRRIRAPRRERGSSSARGASWRPWRRVGAP